MTDSITPRDCDDENIQREKQEIMQNRPSHMNQGNKTFIPDKEKSRVSGNKPVDQKSGTQETDHSRKAS